MTAVLAVPYWNCPDLIETCVRSVLAQDEPDLVCLVIGDGEEPPLAGVRDDRLVVYTLPENRGAYYALQLMLLASPHEWFGPVGADDWIGPDHLSRLLSYGSDVATGIVWYHNGEKTKTITKVYEVGLYRAERLRSFGGYNPAERLGQDSLLIHLLRLTGGLAYTQHPTYHRVQRYGSLTTDPMTKKGSPARNEMRARNRAIVRTCELLRTPDRIRAYRESLIPPALAEELAAHVEQLRRVLA